MGADLYIHSLQSQQNAQGYFRDPYNNWDLLWQFELSWWNDVLPRLDAEDNLAVPGIEWLLGELKIREHTFEERIEGLRPEEQEYFWQRYAELKAFLSRAIERSEAIQCSL